MGVRGSPEGRGGCVRRQPSTKTGARITRSKDNGKQRTYCRFRGSWNERDFPLLGVCGAELAQGAVLGEGKCSRDAPPLVLILISVTALEEEGPAPS